MGSYISARRASEAAAEIAHDPLSVHGADVDPPNATKSVQTAEQTKATSDLHAAGECQSSTIETNETPVQTGAVESSGLNLAQFGDQEQIISVRFERQFREPPTVILTPTAIDSEKQVNLRLSVTAVQVTGQGFNVRIFKWWDTKLFKIRVNWAAFPTGKISNTGIQIGECTASGNGKLTNEGFQAQTTPINFKTPFKEVPQIFVAPRLYDVDCQTNHQSRMEPVNECEQGFAVKFKKFGDCKIYDLKCYWLASGALANRTDQRMESGEVSSASSGVLKNHGDQEELIAVKFDHVFEKPPQILITPVFYDVGGATSFRIDVSAIEVTSEGFKAKLRKWMDTEIYEVKAVWIAVSQF